MSYIPEQGDIISLEINPGTVSESAISRPALVLSKKSFNAHVKMALVAPKLTELRR